jgi:hypothetical protein
MDLGATDHFVSATFCNAGSYGVAVGAATVANGMACLAGSFTSESTPGASVCVVCAVGNFAPTASSTVVLPV